MSSRLSTFLKTARALGRGPGEQAAILWALSKNVRVRFGLSRYHPQSVYTLSTRFGPVHLRDNFGDVTNLPGLWMENEYRAGQLQDEGAVLDVGANIGLFSAWVAAHNPERAIHSFEPLPSNVAMIRLNCPTAVVNQMGLGRERSTLMLEVDDQGIMATSVPQAWKTTPIVVSVERLDDHAAEHGIGPVAFMKIDTEGMELDVLDGGREVLSRTARVAMETHGAERHRATIERLEAAGMSIDDQSTDGRTGLVFASRRRGAGH